MALRPGGAPPRCRTFSRVCRARRGTGARAAGYRAFFGVDETMTLEIRIVQRGEDHILERVADDLFDHPVRKDLAAEFIADPRHHMAVAIDDGLVVGFASGVHYVHPDKPAELWVNEVAVAPSHQRRGVAKAVLCALIEHGRTL